MSQLKKISSSSSSAPGYLTSSVFFVALSLLSAGFNYMYYPVIARMMTPSAFGATQALIAILLQVGAVFSGLNLVTIYLVHTLDESATTRSVEILQKITTIAFLVATFVVLVAQNFVMHFLHLESHAYLYIVVFDLISAIPFIIAFGFLVARKRFIAAGFLQLTIVFVKLVLGGAATAKYGPGGALMGIGLGQVIGMAIFWLVCNITGIPVWEHKIIQSLKPPSRADIKFIKPYRVNIGAIFIVNLLLVLFISFDIIAARHYFEPSLSGLYAGASTLSNAIVFVCLPLVSVLLPHLDRSSLRTSRPELIRTTGMLAAIIVVSIVILAVVPRQLLGIFGKNYQVMSYLLVRLGILMSLVSAMSLVLQVGAFYRPVRTAFICLLSITALVLSVIAHHASPLSFVSTIMTVFATILLIGAVQLIWIYTHANPKIS